MDAQPFYQSWQACLVREMLGSGGGSAQLERTA
jgi:hypothetical protein